MKNISFMPMNLPKKWWLTCLVLSLAAGRLCAQRYVSDARIVYRLELPPEQAQLDAMLEGSTLTQYIRGHLSRIDMDLHVVRYTYIIDSRQHTLVTLIDSHSGKYLIRSGSDEYEKDLKRYTGIHFKDEPGTRELVGYNCQKATGTMPEGETFEVYYARDLIPENKHYSRRFMNLKGIPLQFEIITKTGAKMRAIATSVDLQPVPASYFEVPASGYKLISKEELERIRN